MYKGNWFEGKKHGLGDYIYAQGTVLHGTWVDGICHGPAEVITEGPRLHGLYQEGRLVGPTVFSFDRKYMAVGYMAEVDSKKRKTRVFGADEFEELSKAKDEARPQTEWLARETKLFQFSELPQEPIPLPVKDSSEMICRSISALDEEVEAEDIGEGEEEVKSEEIIDAKVVVKTEEIEGENEGLRIKEAVEE